MYWKERLEKIGSLLDGYAVLAPWLPVVVGGLFIAAIIGLEWYASTEIGLRHWGYVVLCAVWMLNGFLNGREFRNNRLQTGRRHELERKRNDKWWCDVIFAQAAVAATVSSRASQANAMDDPRVLQTVVTLFQNVLDSPCPDDPPDEIVKLRDLAKRVVEDGYAAAMHGQVVH